MAETTEAKAPAFDGSARPEDTARVCALIETMTDLLLAARDSAWAQKIEGARLEATLMTGSLSAIGCVLAGLPPPERQRIAARMGQLALDAADLADKGLLPVVLCSKPN